MPGNNNQDLIQLVGKGNANNDPVLLEQYSKDNSTVSPMMPDCIVTPATTQEIQEIVRWANSTRTPLIPVSSLAPHFRGDTVPSSKDSVIVALDRMKRVMRIDRRNRVAMVEPGVTFSELIPELREHGMRANLPLLPRSGKSVVASMLEREPAIMPKYQWDISDPLACTEVILATGDLLRTGSAAGPGPLEEQWKAGHAQNAAPGPAQFDPHRLIQGSQGTMGIVTWATLRCERFPQVQEPFLVGSASPERLFELIHWLIRLKLADECLILNRTNLSTILTTDGYERGLTEHLPDWILFFCIAGYEYFPEERVSYQRDQMLDVAERTNLKPTESIGRASAQELLNRVMGASPEPYWKIQRKGSCNELFFLATQERIPELIRCVRALAHQHGYPSEEVGIYLQPIVQGTSYHCEFDFFFDQESSKEWEQARALCLEALKACMDRGAFFSRPYPLWADEVFRKDKPAASALKKIKSIFDPNGIMNPGKLCFE